MEPVVEQVRLETGLAALSPVRCGAGEKLGELAHEAKNMVTALGIYCDLLEEPGVLAESFAHYGSELRLVTAASRRLVERLAALNAEAGRPETAPGSRPGPALAAPGDDLDEAEAESTSAPYLIEELLANYNLLAALAGPSIAVTVEADGGAQPVHLTGEGLTRVLMNLVKNAAEAMPEGGRIRIAVTEHAAGAGRQPGITIAVEDSGPGIPEEALETIFERGYTTRADRGGSASPRGLGLAISRSMVEAAGGRLVATRHHPGARLEIELPVRVEPTAEAAHRLPGLGAAFVVS
jgi:signal transduction histidine kinase